MDFTFLDPFLCSYDTKEWEHRVDAPSTVPQVSHEDAQDVPRYHPVPSSWLDSMLWSTSLLFLTAFLLSDDLLAIY